LKESEIRREYGKDGNNGTRRRPDRKCETEK
jgi:hypothetical protein